MNGTSQSAMLDMICPMHLVLDSAGTILSAGPTIKKTLGEGLYESTNLRDLFDVKSPQDGANSALLCDLSGQKLRLRAKTVPDLELKGVLMPGLPDDQYLLNLSFGINVVRAVQLYDLTAADFAVTDLTIEMLYLVEAKSAAMDAFETLNVKLEKARVTAEQQASTDALTGLSNRRALDSAVTKLVQTGEVFAMMHLDLDFFKAINDTHGHAAGDAALKRVAHVLTSETRARDIVARFGGDEFVVILRDAIDPKGVERIADRIMRALGEATDIEGEILSLSASAGTAISTDYPTPDAEAMAMDADMALYAAKRDGRGCHRFYHIDMRQPATAGLQAKADKRIA